MEVVPDIAKMATSLVSLCIFIDVPLVFVLIINNSRLAEHPLFLFR